MEEKDNTIYGLYSPHLKLSVKLLKTGRFSVVMTVNFPPDIHVNTLIGFGRNLKRLGRDIARMGQAYHPLKKKKGC